MMVFEGDPKIYDTGDGAEILISSGQPKMDEGIENAAYLSLFGGSQWWGNVLSTDDEKLRSEFETVFRRTLTNATRLDAEQYATDALAWMKSAGIVKNITVESSIPSVGFLALTITIEQPDKTSTIRYQINWATFAVRVGTV